VQGQGGGPHSVNAPREIRTPLCAHSRAPIGVPARAQQGVHQRFARDVSGVARVARVVPGRVQLMLFGVRAFVQSPPERHARSCNSRNVRWLFAGWFWTESMSGKGLSPDRLVGGALGGWWTESGMITCRWVDFGKQK
jgi:hypothetical protein